MSNKRKASGGGAMRDPAEVPKDQAVTIAYVVGDSVTYSWHRSLVELIAYDSANRHRVMRGGFIAMHYGTGGLIEARNKGVKTFLEEDNADWLFWVDTDMGFAPDTIDLLMDAADPVERPMVGALCFSQREDSADGFGGYRCTATPTIFDWAHIDGQYGWQVRWNYPQNTVMQVGGTGAACVLVHRSVFEKIQAEHGNVWYDRVPNTTTGQLISEDLSFCLRAGALKIPMFVHTGVPTTHFKNLWLSEEDYWRQVALNSFQEKATEMGFMPETTESKRDWTVPRYAVVPTHNRPARLSALVASLGDQCDRIVVLDNASTPPVDEKHLQSSVPDRCTVEVIRDEEQPPNLARFWNVMFDRCAEVQTKVWDDSESAGWTMPLRNPWDVAVLNDDSVVPAGWYDAVAVALREHKTAVVAHTGDRPIPAPDLLTDFNFARSRRMAPHGFVVRGEAGLRADESMRWWYFDDDFCRQAIQAGGVLGVPGPVVVNAQANQSTSGVLVEQAEKDRATFEAKWSR